jgi:hypothetical protein
LNSPWTEYSVLRWNFYSPGKKLRLLEPLFASGPPYLTVFIFSGHTAMWTAEFCGYKKDSYFSFMVSQTGEKKALVRTA